MTLYIARRSTARLLGTGLLWLTTTMAGATSAVVAPTNPPLYAVNSIAVDSLLLAAPQLPDLKPYSAEAVYAKIKPKPAGTVVVRGMLKENALAEFTGGDERLREWVKRQGETPQAIFIDGGYVTPADLARSLPEKYFRETAPGVYLARLPIVVSQRATLHIGKQTKDFRLSSERGAFLINDGKLFITDSRLTAWRETGNQQDWFKTKGEFRPFLNAWGGTETYIVNSHIASLGYSGTKSYGVSISQYSPGIAPTMGRGHPTGWLIDSVFDDMWYGFYCYEADDVVLKGNTYKNNIVYGIDPHDRSRRLIIAGNTVYGTQKKHGIIISRDVNDSWIFNNRSFDNNLSGLVLDRLSINNVVADNELYRNKSDGITLYESGNNLLWANKSFENARHGIRVRNSMNVRLYENLAVANGLLGIYGHTKDLNNVGRNLKQDPYSADMSLTVVGGRLIANRTGDISVVAPRSVKLYRLEILLPNQPSGIGMFGALSSHKNQIIDLLVRQKKAVEILPVDQLAQSGQ
ncbi:mannuronan 5-epimerase AlgG [Pseudomonas sp.]|uniref:mannuronan 5-epimerase AlgG n=1 Tax=Pseudomonas sp. TaxID=306 RepID=UPI003525FCA2